MCDGVVAVAGASVFVVVVVVAVVVVIASPAAWELCDVAVAADATTPSTSFADSDSTIGAVYCANVNGCSVRSLTLHQYYS